MPHSLNDLAFIITNGNILHFFIVRAILEAYDPKSHKGK